MAGNQFGARGYLFKQGGDVCDESFNTAATLQVDKRKHPRKEVIAEVDHIRTGEEDDAVAVSVPVWEVNRPDFFAVEMDRQRLVERNHRQRFRRRRRRGRFKEL